MTALADAVQDYLDVRRAVGFKLVAHARLLADLVADVEAGGAATVTVDAALAWATKPADADPVWWATRLGVARGFARYLKVIDSSTEIPPADLLPRRARRPEPHIYSDAEIQALMAAARALRPPLRAATFETVIGLLMVTGMRPGEAIRLDCGDLDASRALLTVRDSKFRKCREIPLHQSTLAALHAYIRTRDQLCPRPRTTRLFISPAGTALVHTSVDRVFQTLVSKTGLDDSGHRSPRLHDARHSYAVRTVIGWYRNGVDVDAHMALLSTMMGHAEPANTYWYLSAVPELFALAVERLERPGGERP